MKKIRDILAGTMLIGGIVTVIILIVTLPTMLLWNWLMPVIFGLPKIGILQSLGLLVLSTLLFFRPS